MILAGTHLVQLWAVDETQVKEVFSEQVNAVRNVNPGAFSVRCHKWDGQWNINPDLLPEEKEQILQILHEYQDLFTEEEGRPDWGMKGIEYRIKLTPGAKPVRAKRYRQSPQQNEIMRENDELWLERGIIHPGSGPWAALQLAVPKPDHTWRICTDYRELNDVMLFNAYPLSLPEDIVEFLGDGGSNMVSELDAKQGF